jgi:hypothetical protein
VHEVGGCAVSLGTGQCDEFAVNDVVSKFPCVLIYVDCYFRAESMQISIVAQIVSRRSQLKTDRYALHQHEVNLQQIKHTTELSQI